MINIKTAIKYLFFVAFLIVMFASCIPTKKQTYLQAPEDSDTIVSFFKQQQFEYKIKSGDKLYINITSADQERLMLLSTSSNNNQQQPSAIYLNSFNVNEKGFVFLPLIGNINVVDKNVYEIEEMILDEISKYINSTSILVNVKLVNFNITIMGEVNNPGHYSVYEDKINIFEAVSMGGDMTWTADRSDVLLIRENVDGSEIIHMDLLEDEILLSEYYYLLPGDIVYVKPVKNKNLVFVRDPYTFILSVISTLILIATFTQNRS